MNNPIEINAPAAGKAEAAEKAREKRAAARKRDAVAREAIAAAAVELGGVERLVAWAREDEKNEQIFWVNIYPKLLSLQAADAGAGAAITRIERVIVRPKD